MDFDSFVLAAATADLDDEADAREHADAVEFRMDLAEDPLEQLDDYDGVLPLIATNRAEWEGGEADDAGRLDDLAAAAEHDLVEAVDVELNAVRHGGGSGVVDHAREHDAAAIASIHDFDGTPSADEMRGMLADAVGNADVGKLAVTANDPADVLTLLMLTREFSAQGESVATMAMGEPGRHSRAVAPVYGSRIGYAPVDPDEATAPGQYDLATLRRLVEDLRSKPEV
ncbi:type I 3-dehydroquinate dehydratase [Halostella sp. JP-L12]|uniref:type I 3-dehydroquinate dehydratase n=1 Tax=Halostella TaxID=1843185 RepID=UPI000EF78DC5|nr:MULTISPECIES: type I 3-dehydroquinate dehydratase [Halostella]NHN47495.1 type I 3-dehydroquinate dehydratase [Halostella sp. JP-L12]